MKSAFWKRDWFTGLLIVLAVLLIHKFTTVFDGIERSAYDWGVKSSDASPSEQIAVVAIDENSIANIGRWPWPRGLQAEVIGILAQANPAVIGYVPLFSEPQKDPGLTYIGAIRDQFEQSALNELAALAEVPEINDASIDTSADSLLDDIQTEPTVKTASTEPAEPALDPFTQRAANDASQILLSLYEAEDALNADLQLSQAMAFSGNVITPQLFTFDNPYRKPDPLPDYVQRFALNNVVDNIGAELNGLLPFESTQSIYPIQEYGEVAAGVGHINVLPDVDGGIRAEALVMSYNQQYYPSFALAVAASYLGLTPEDIELQLGQGIRLGRLQIQTDPYLRMNNFFYKDGSQPAFSVDSVFDIVTEKIPLSKFEGKVVLVGPTAGGIGSTQVTPIHPAMPPVLALAHTVSSILNEDFFIKPDWGPLVTALVIVLVALFLMFLLPRLGARNGAIATVFLVVAFVGTHYTLMTGSSMWIELMLPTSMLLIGYLLMTTKNFLVTERGKMRSDLDNAETNRMLGLAFQGQGNLDMAFDKFRKCPVDNSLMEVLYNLALDYERKRQFAKAGNVYQHIAAHDVNFRDVKQRIERSKKMEETVVLGGSAGGAAGTLIMEGDDVQKPMLGRYQVEKELGKGAMGVVYLGEDPKISRTVAIKTMALSQEFDEDELDEVKERFFREAETAGRLNHPNIVTIYDAGEEHDLAYIAMEFLRGKDLVPYTKPNNLLPLATALDLVAQCADALAYAHTQNVVHRDIKPANIMYDPESGSLKVTDFGIARITDASKTKTGVVLGTPSYMSPEQLAGKRVDGRSDLFSLGVMLYQMATGQLPFQADSMATLMFKITNDPTPSIHDVNPELPVKLDLIIAKALEKDPDHRYQTGAEMCQELKALVQELG